MKPTIPGNPMLPRPPFARTVAAMMGSGLCWLALASERGAFPVEVFDAQTMEGAAMSTHLVQQADGRLLVANMRGLFRYDGTRWTLYLHPKAMGGMEFLAQEADGRVYTTFNGDIGYWLDDATGDLQWHSELARLPEDCRDVAAEAVGVHATRGGMLYVSATRLAFVPRDATATPVCRAQQSLQKALTLGDDVLVVSGAPSVLYRLDADFSPTPLAHPLELPTYFATLTRPQDTLLLSSDGRISRYQDGKISLWSEVLHERHGRGLSRPFRSIVELPDGRIAVAGQLDGLFLLEGDGTWSEHLGERDGIPVRRATHGMMVDRHGDVWMAQERSIARVSIGAVSVFDERHGLPSAAQIARWNGHLAVAARTGLMVLQESAQGASFHAPLPDLLGLQTVARLSDEVLLVSNPALHAIRRDDAGWRQERLPLRWPNIMALEPSRLHRHRVYAGHAEGLLQIDQLDDGRITVTDIGALRMPIVRIAEQDADTLWVAGRVSGALRVPLADPASARVYGDAEGLPEGTVRPYAGPNRTWFTTLAGLRTYDAAADRFVAPPTLPASLVSDRLYSAYEDHEGNLWVRGGAILNDVFWRDGEGWRIDRDVLHGVDPFPTIYGFVREQNVVWAIRASGLMRIDLDALRPTPPSPSPLVTQVSDSRARSALPFGALAALAPETRDLRVEFALPFLRRGAATLYRSRLAGFEDWSEWTASGQQARIYTNLPDGRFRFEVEARDSLQREWRMTPLTIGVSPPWFRTPLAMALYVLGAMAALWLASQMGARRRQRQMFRRQQELEAVVEARTAELRASNAQLAEQAERLAEVDRLKTRFFVNVGHEFRTPLTLVLGPLDDLLRDARERLSERVRGQLQLAQRNAQRVLDLIVELLDVNRLEQGQLRLSTGIHDLIPLLQRVARDNAPLVERFGQTLEVESGGCRAAPCRIDPLQMERAISNLIGNAAKYSPRGTRIVLALAHGDGVFTVSVSDQGRGIAPDALPHVFDRFFQTDGSSSASGYGIGLSLVREIALAHGGEVGASSTLGVGSRFELHLPIPDDVPAGRDGRAMAAADAAPEGREDRPDPSPVAARHDAPPAQAAPDVTPGTGRQRVLIVDDHDDLRQRVRGLLGHRFEVLEAADGNTAWQLARDELPDLIVSDVMMPGCDGVELTRRLRSHGDTQAIGILLLTAKVGSEHAVAGLGAGANDYLAKPFDASELLARCEAIVAHARRLQHRTAAAAPAVPADAFETPDSRWRQRLDQHIAANLHEPGFNIEALARRMHVDRTQLFRKCKELLGQSPSDYLRDTRLAHGHRLLEQAAGNVSEVAYASGFDSLSAFTRAFKMRYGVPPSQVRGSAA